MNLAALVVAGMMALGGLTTGPGVTGNGQQTIKVMPDTMEMVVNLQASDEQFDKALAAVQQQDADLEKALRGLQTAPAEVKSEGPWLGPAVGNDRESRLRQEVMRAMGRATPGQPEEKAKVMLSMTVTAKWKLTAREGVALLKETEALREAVRAALPKPAVPEVAATEEQEEQMLAAARQTGEEGEPPGTPAFSFTAAVPADKVADAKAQAFKKARTEAESLAQAAGMKLGSLRSLSGGSSPQSAEEAYYYAMTGRGSSSEEEGVVRSADARELTQMVKVEVVFDMTP
jgi:uncharacterized protein YggE